MDLREIIAMIRISGDLSLTETSQTRCSLGIRVWVLNLGSELINPSRPVAFAPARTNPAAARLYVAEQ